MDNAIEFKNVYKSFADQVVLANASLILPQKGITVIYGRSGIGKSTILSLIAGFDSVDQGEILIRNRVVSNKDESLPSRERNLSMQFQGLALWPHMNAGQHLSFVRDGISIARLQEVIESVGFPPEKLKRYPHELSGGERQRLALARTIAADTDIMLFDEPFNNLDEKLRIRVTQTLSTLSLHKAIIIIQHDTSVLLGNTTAKRWYKMENNQSTPSLFLVDPHAQIT